MRMYGLILALLLMSMAQPVVGDSLVLVNGDDLKGDITLLPEGKIELSHGILGKVSLASKDVTGGQIKVTLADGSVVSGFLVGCNSDQRWGGATLSVSGNPSAVG